jgi:hypothetical protein
LQSCLVNGFGIKEFGFLRADDVPDDMAFLTSGLKYDRPHDCGHGWTEFDQPQDVARVVTTNRRYDRKSQHRLITSKPTSGPAEEAVMGDQRYVSNELTHFVGRSLSNDDERYDLLIKIIKGGVLSYPPHDVLDKSLHLQVNFSAAVTEDGFAVPMIICLCDIPLVDLKLHMQKYSQFGLCFSRATLVEKGASPVFYVAKDALSNIDTYFNLAEFKDKIELSTLSKKVTKELYYDTHASATIKFLGNLLALAQPAIIGEGPFVHEKSLNAMGISSALINTLTTQLRDNPNFSVPANAIFMFLAMGLFGLIKGFDSRLAEDDPNNYYMEREWRVVGSYVDFKITDLQRVILPKRYAERFRKDLPGYFGQIHFADE